MHQLVAAAKLRRVGKQVFPVRNADIGSPARLQRVVDRIEKPAGAQRVLHDVGADDKIKFFLERKIVGIATNHADVARRLTELAQVVDREVDRRYPGAAPRQQRRQGPPAATDIADRKAAGTPDVSDQVLCLIAEIIDPQHRRFQIACRQ